MSSDRYHNYYVDGAAHFWTSSIINRIQILRPPTAARRVIAIFDEYRRKYEVKLLGYVVMPDHFHLIVRAEKGEQVELFFEQMLRRVSSDLVEMTAKAAARGDRLTLRWLEVFRSKADKRSKARLWKERGHGFPITDHDTLLQKLEYMHNNPVKAGLVARPEDWEFSSAAWYSEGRGPIELDALEL